MTLEYERWLILGSVPVHECFRALVSILKRQARTRPCFSFRGSPPLLCPKRTWVFNHEGSKEHSYQDKAHCPCSWKPGLGADSVADGTGETTLGPGSTRSVFSAQAPAQSRGGLEYGLQRTKPKSWGLSTAVLGIPA